MSAGRGVHVPWPATMGVIATLSAKTDTTTPAPQMRSTPQVSSSELWARKIAA